MSRVTKLQKENVLKLYSDLKPLKDSWLDWCVKESAQNIYVDRHNNGWCTKCETKVILPKTKHKQVVACPNCKKNMTITHNWRYADPERRENRVNWYVFPDVINKNVLAMRYVAVDRERYDEPKVSERARLVIDFQKQKHYTLEKNHWTGEWRYSTWDYFRESGMGYYWRKWCCLEAALYPRLIKRINKIAGMENLEFKLDYFSHLYSHSVITWMYKRADLYEKMQKVGLDKLIDMELRVYSGNTITYDKKQTSLTKMLNLNKTTLGLLKTCQTHDALKWLQEHPNANEKALHDASLLKFSTRLEKVTKQYHFGYEKALTYLKKQLKPKEELVALSRDYADYIDTINRLGYPLDNQYLYPKDFRKADAKANAEYIKKLEEIKKMEESKKDKTIRAISVALRENKMLRKWMSGSNGLKVIVPESAEELRKEGIALHNCLGTYINRVASKETLIFFIRKLDDPSKEFIAMEYRKGEIVQIRLDNNVAVKDAQILDFANHFVAQLNKIDVFTKLKKVA